ncbi:SDR family NAD(P)-dependent oxidoreductase [Bradyrhizobium sp. CCBAU 51765]|uniref:SDR family NAD(P)-dependent oxidoreductase n=1 Tax=Bradyrhizobium sp. CCBAU 51765 TaxID=1325102 RepID=UPI00188977F0|nr:SDR family oxidoreductase [Bradyrhizobium sp. CCBAU 51765]QOZ13496.1 alcohol dehydrogenase [Bradyrhizobium sp. CCBAU 51765]
MNVQTIEAVSQHPMSLHGKVALIVGGYGAIGTTISEVLTLAGATSIIAGRTGDQALALAADLAAQGFSAHGIELDACDANAVHAVSACLKQQHGSIDILVNCTGFNKEQMLFEVTPEAFDEVYSRTLRAGMFLSQAVAAQQLSAERGGSHIHLLSVRSSFGFRNRGYSAFCAAKGGLAVLLKQLATELGPYGITVNGVAPGLVRTQKNETVFDDPTAFKRATANIPLARLATPEDVAGAVHFFASSLSRFVTGQILRIDGGLTAST